MSTPTEKPQNPYVHAMCDDNGFTQYGISLRDYYANSAMQAIVQSKDLRELFARKGELSNTDWMDVVAQNSFNIADAMLRQREL